MIKWLYQKATGTPWTTSWSCTEEYGPTIADRYPELCELSDAELCAMTPDQAIAWAERDRALLARGGVRYAQPDDQRCPCELCASAVVSGRPDRTRVRSGHGRHAPA
jgi:hypothetical protein